MDLSSSEYCFQNFLISAQDEIFAPFLEEIKNNISQKDQNLYAIKRMNIYLDSYRFRLIQSLKKDYPKLMHLMDSDSFENLAKSYIKEFPSKYFSIKFFGQHLNEFIKNTKPYSEKTYLYEMASFEVCLHEISLEKDFNCLDKKSLDNLPLSNFCDLKLQFNPLIKLLIFNWNTPEVWQEINESNTLEQLDGSIKSFLPVLYSKPKTWIIGRKGVEVNFRSIDENELYALEKMKMGMNFAELCDSLCQIMKESSVPSFSINCLNQWLKNGLIINFNLD